MRINNGRTRRMKAVRAVVPALALVLVAPQTVATAVIAPTPIVTAAPPASATHSSGLTVRGPEEAAPVPEDLAEAYGTTQFIAEAYPKDFSDPWIDATLHKVMLGVVTDRAAKIFTDLVAGIDPTADPFATASAGLDVTEDAVTGGLITAQGAGNAALDATQAALDGGFNAEQVASDTAFTGMNAGLTATQGAENAAFGATQAAVDAAFGAVADGLAPDATVDSTVAATQGAVDATVGATQGAVDATVAASKEAVDATVAATLQGAEDAGLGPQEKLAKQFEPSAALSVLLSNNVQTVPVSHSRARAVVQAVANAVIDLGHDPRFDTVEQPYQSEVDETVGHAVLTVVQLSDALANEIVRLYGTEVVEVRVDPNRPDLELMSEPRRDADYSPFYGGAKIGPSTSTGNCSDGFSWDDGSTYMMLTAGHCRPDGGSIATPAMPMGSVRKDYEENYKSGVGTVSMMGNDAGAYRGDLALIRISSGKASLASTGECIAWNDLPASGGVIFAR